jgi:alpha-tubulin suppressor-like RCC1 family protein
LGKNHAIGTNEAGDLVGIGNNTASQLGSNLPQHVISFTKINIEHGTITGLACGDSFSAFLADGKIFATGTANFCTKDWRAIKKANVQEIKAGGNFLFYRKGL